MINVSHMLDEAEALLNKGNNAQAIELINSNFQNSEKSAQVYTLLSKAHENEGDIQKSIDYCCLALECEPENAEALERLARLRNAGCEEEVTVPAGLDDTEIILRARMAEKRVKDLKQFFDLNIVYLNLTSYCNYKCRHCYFVHSTWKDIDFRRSLIPLNTINKWLENIDRGLQRLESLLGIPYDKSTICIQPQGAGEPLLHPQFAQVIRSISKYGFATRMSTNGSMLYGDRADALFESNLNTLHISLDAASDQIYKNFRVGGNYQKVLNNIETFINRYKNNDKKPYFIVSFCCTPHNVSDAKKFAEHWIKKVNAVWFQQFNDTSKTSDEKQSTAPLVSRKFCASLPGFFMIEQDGHTKGCQCGQVIAGNINEKSFEDMILSPERIAIFSAQEENRFNEIEACKDCMQWYAVTPFASKGMRIGNQQYKMTPGGGGVYIFNQESDLGRIYEENCTLDSPDWLYPLTLPDGRPLYKKTERT